MTAPWLSVLMPTYNGANYLRDALDSVVEQGDPNIECIAVDDGSSDTTREILVEYGDRLDLTMIERPHGGNWVVNSNLALEQARGEFACLLHQDDIWLPGRLEALRSAMRRDPAVDLFLHPAWFIDPTGRRLGLWRCPMPKDGSVLDAALILPRLLVQNFIAIPSPLFRTSIARDVGALDEDLWYTADWDFWLKLGNAGKTLYLPSPMAGFRVHGEAQSSRRTFQIVDIRAQHETVLERHLPLAKDSLQGRVRRRAELSIAVNIALASSYHGLRPDFAQVTMAALRAGPVGIWNYATCARIWERVRARLKLRARVPVPSAAE